MTQTACSECETELNVEAHWIMLTVKDSSGYTTGFICSLNCLIDYVATVNAMEDNEDHPRWEPPE